MILLIAVLKQMFAMFLFVVVDVLCCVVCVIFVVMGFVCVCFVLCC